VIAHAAAVEHVVMRTPGAIDESAYHLTEADVMHLPHPEAGAYGVTSAASNRAKHDGASGRASNDRA
jgi:hypothetical protein